MSGRCTMVLSKVRCERPSAYRLWFATCECCYRHGFVMCDGHRVCVECAAETRAEKYAWSDDLGGADANAAMVTS